MSYTLNDNIRNLVPYTPISGDYAVRMDANESFLPLSDEICREGVQRMAELNFNRYPDPYAAALCEKFAVYYGIDPALVTAGNGSDELISLIVGTLFSDRQELATLSHDFSMYRLYGEIFSTRTAVFPKNSDLTVNTAALIEYLKNSGAKGLIFSNPCNPTSLCLGREEVLRIAASVPDCLIIVDEAYMDFGSESVLSVVNAYENLLVLKTASKAVGMAALRLGFAVANEKLTQALRAVKSPYNVNALSQSFGTLIYENLIYLKDCTQQIIAARETLYQGLCRLAGQHQSIETVYPSSTNFVFLKIKESRQIFEALKARAVIVRDMNGFLRICAGNERETDLFFEAFSAIMGQLEGVR